MTCRFELEFKGQSYPLVCEECLFGPCKCRYTQIKNDTGYTLVDSQYRDRHGRPIGADGKPFVPHEGSIPPERMDYTNDKPDLSQIPAKELASKITIEKYAVDLKPRLTRVQRARLMDLIADIAKDDNSDQYTDTELSDCVEKILNIIDNPEG